MIALGTTPLGAVLDALQCDASSARSLLRACLAGRGAVALAALRGSPGADAHAFWTGETAMPFPESDTHPMGREGTIHQGTGVAPTGHKAGDRPGLGLDLLDEALQRGASWVLGKGGVESLMGAPGINGASAMCLSDWVAVVEGVCLGDGRQVWEGNGMGMGMGAGENIPECVVLRPAGVGIDALHCGTSQNRGSREMPGAGTALGAGSGATE